MSDAQISVSTIRIIQITTGQEDVDGHTLYGLDNEGNLYFWSKKFIKTPKYKRGDLAEYSYGWESIPNELDEL